MKILILTSRFPYPLDKGDKLRAYHQLKWIAKKHDVHLVCTTDEYVSNKEVESLKSELNIEISVFRLYRLNQLISDK